MDTPTQNPAMENLIRTYGLSPHPEGGWYKEIYRSEFSIHSDRAGSPRAAVTHIYFLLGKGELSRFHRVVHDEIWHLYRGDPLTLHLFNGTALRTRTIGPGQPHYTAVVPGNVWQAAESTGDYSFMGCTVAPGFDFEDFTFLSEASEDLDGFKNLTSDLHRFL